MRHADDGSLRRLLDEDWAVGEPLRQHVARCGRCQERLRAMAELRDENLRLLGTAAEPGDAAAALARQRALQAEGRQPRVNLAWPRLDAPRRWAAGVAAFAVLLALVTATPVGGYARNLMLIFEPVHFKAISVKPDQARTILQLSSLGTLRTTAAPALTAEPDLEALQSAVGFALQVPASLPAGVPQPTFAFLGAQTRSLTLSGQKLEEYATAHHVKLPPMPANISGSVISVTTGRAAVMSYGVSAVRLEHANRLPELIVAEAPLPKVYSNGATVAEIERYLLALPGVSPQVAAEIQTIASPSTTLPVPVPLGKATSQPAMVGSAQGLWLQQGQGGVGGVVWTRGGYVYGVGGTLSRAELLSIAASMR